MQDQLTVSIFFKAPAARVWKGLTDPDIVKQYFFGTILETRWEKGSPIFFRGEWEGKAYEDKGTILSIRPGSHVSYNYWSSMSGTDDHPDNYQIISYDLAPKDGGTELVVTQETSPEKKEHSENNWRTVLGGLKALIEKP